MACHIQISGNIREAVRICHTDGNIESVNGSLLQACNRFRPRHGYRICSKGCIGRNIAFCLHTSNFQPFKIFRLSHCLIFRHEMTKASFPPGKSLNTVSVIFFQYRLAYFTVQNPGSCLTVFKNKWQIKQSGSRNIATGVGICHDSHIRCSDLHSGKHLPFLSKLTSSHHINPHFSLAFFFHQV